MKVGIVFHPLYTDRHRRLQAIPKMFTVRGRSKSQIIGGAISNLKETGARSQMGRGRNLKPGGLSQKAQEAEGARIFGDLVVCSRENAINNI